MYRARPDSDEGEVHEHLGIVGNRHNPNPPTVMKPLYDVLVFEVGRQPRWVGDASEGTGPGTFTVVTTPEVN